VFSGQRVTQDNTGKNTAGVDGVKSLSPVARFRLANNLKLGSKVNRRDGFGFLNPEQKKKDLWASL